MKLDSLLCMAGYMVAAILILMMTDRLEGVYEPIFACAGAIPIGYWCSWCDALEGP